MNCPRCGAANPDDLLFCQECNAFLLDGASEPEPPTFEPSAEGLVRCRACGAESALGTVFCPTCGRLLFVSSVRHEEVGSLRSGLKPRFEAAPSPGHVGQPDTLLPQWCPCCGRPIDPERAQCSRCGASAVALAAAQEEALAIGTEGPNGDDNSVWNSIMSVWNRTMSVLRVIDFLRSFFPK